mgnify:CR=1 FL=1
MSSEFKLTGDLFPPGFVNNFKDEVQKAFATELTDEVARIQLRTRQGRDKDDTTFKPLSSAYAAYKAAGGRVNVKRRPNNAGKIRAAARRPVSNQVNPTDLRFTGQMLQALTQTTERGNSEHIGRVGFLSADAVKKALGNIENGRDFFGLTKEFTDRLYARIKQIWSK